MGSHGSSGGAGNDGVKLYVASLPPDTTHNDKGMAGSKKGDTRLQFATCCVLAFYVFHYTPFFGLAFERCTALFFFVTPVALERTAAVLASTSDAAINFSTRYGLPHYRDEKFQQTASLRYDQFLETLINLKK